MKLRDEYIHGSDQLGVVKSIVSISGNTLKFKRADNSETVVDITIGNLSVNTSGKASTAGTADQVKTSLTFTGGVTGTWNGSSAKTIAIPTKSSWNYDDKYLQLTGGTVTGATTFEQAVNTDILGNSTTTDRFKNARTINGVSFDGTANITITANPNSHTHGNISNGGAITSAAVTPADTDYILISDTSNNGKIERGITIGTSISTQSQTTKFLREDGTWAAPSYTLNTNTHRPIQVGGTQILGNNTTVLNLVQGNNITLTAEKSGDNYTGKVTIAGKANNYQTPQITATSTSQPAFKLGAKGGDETNDMYIYYATSLKNTSGSNGSSITAAKDGIIKNSEGETGTGWKLAKIYNGNVYYYNTDTKVKLTATDGTTTDRYIPFSTTGTSLSSGSAYELFYQADFKYNPGTKLFSVPNITLSNKLIASLGEIDSLTTGNLVVQGTSSIGTVTAGTWNGTRLTSSYIPTDVVYTAASQALTNKTYNGYTLAEACARGVDTSISANSTSTNLPTTAAVESRIKAHSGIDKVGTVTSVSSGTGISVTGTTTVNPTINLANNYGDIKNPYASKTKKYFLAAPNNANGVPTFRAIVASDIPTLNQNTTGSAATLTTSRNLWGNSFNGSASINGCIDFGDTIGESLKWTSGSWWQRIYITDDSNADTAVFSFQQRPGTGDYVNLLTIRDNGTLDLHKTGSIVNLKKQGGIYWDPYIESTTDSSDAASITLRTGTRVGNTTLGTVLTISQWNDFNDTIQFVTNESSTLYHNSNAIITSGNYTSYISGTDRGGDIDKGVSAYNALGLAGTDTDAIINRWEEVKDFLKNISQDSDLASTLAKFVTLDTAQQISGTKTFTQAINGDILGNATTADRFKNSKTISLTGNVTGSATWDASGNLSISTTVSGGSATDNTKVAKAGDTMTGQLTLATASDPSSNISNLKGIKIGDATLSSLNGQAIFFDSILRFTDGHALDWNKWAGLKYDSTNKYIYLGLADNTIFRANAAQSGGKLLLPGISEIRLGSSTNANLVYHTGNKPTKFDVGLGNVDNTADANKSVNYATTAGSAPANGGNSDTVDNYHASEIGQAGWYIFGTSTYSSSDSAGTVWTKIATIDTTSSNIENDMLLELSVYGDQNYTSHIHGYLRITAYSETSTSIVLSTDPMIGGNEDIALYATIDSNRNIWLGRKAYFTCRSLFKVLVKGSKNTIYYKDWETQRTTPNSTYITKNGALKNSNGNIQKLTLSNVNVDYATSSGSCTGNAATVTNGVYTTGSTMTGNLIAPSFRASRNMVLSSGKVYDNISGSNVLINVGTTIFKNGIAITNPITANDVAWLRVTGTGESDTVLEIATGDDAGAGETIVFRGYNTSNTVGYQVNVPKIAGARTMLVASAPTAANYILASNGTTAGDGKWITQSDITAGAVTNGVYTNTNQTITGNKTFTGNILIGENGAGGTIYGNATNGGCNSIRIGDDVILGDVNVGGIMGMKSTGNNAGLKFLKSDGTSIGQLQSTNGTLQWFNSSGTAYNIYHSGNLPAYPTISSLGLDDRYVRLTENQTIAGNKTFTGNTTFSGSSTTMDSLTAGNLVVQGTSALSTITSGTWQGSVIGSSYLPKATNSAIGCIKLSAAADSSAATLTASTDNTFGSTTAKRNYPVKLDSNGIAYVYIPWVNTTYTVPATNVIPANTTANQILLSTATSGKAKWGGVYDCTKQLTLSNNGTYTLSADTWTDIVTISSYETGAYAIFVSDTNSSNTNYYSGIMTIRKANTGRLDEIALHSSMATGSDVDIPTRIFLATQQGVLKATAQAPSSGTNTHTLTIKINRII